MEEAAKEEAAKEALLSASMAKNKQKLLTDLAQEEAAREAQVKSLQQLKDREREGLFESLAQGKFRGERETQLCKMDGREGSERASRDRPQVRYRARNLLLFLLRIGKFGAAYVGCTSTTSQSPAWSVTLSCSMRNIAQTRETKVVTEAENYHCSAVQPLPVEW